MAAPAAKAPAQPQQPLTAAIGSAQPTAFTGAPTVAGAQTTPPGGTPTPMPTGLGGGATGVPTFQPNPQFGAQFGGVGQVPGSLDFAQTPEFSQETDRLGRIRQALGPFSFILPPGGKFSRTYLPAIELALNFQNRLQAEQDRQRSLDLVGEQRGAIGASPESMFAREMAVHRLMNPEPISPEDLSIQQSEIRQRGAIGLEDAMRQFEQSMAQQGLGGSASSFQQAQLEQGGARQISAELQRLAIDNALQQDANEAAAVDRLSGISSEEELRRIALTNALTELLTADRGEFDISGLAAVGPKRTIGGGGALTEISKVLG